jgi:hypothetical protein
VSPDLANEIVTAIAAGAVKSLASESAEALGRLVSALRDKFRSEPNARGTLEIALETPEDESARQGLVTLLQERLDQDPSFQDWLQELWAPVAQSWEVDQSRTANVVRGDVGGHVVQARDVQGGIRIGPSEGAGQPGIEL